jgi:hypothetical protein
MSGRVCYVLSFGFPARTLLHSDLVPELGRRGIAVSAICPGAGEPEMQALAANRGIVLHEAPDIHLRILGRYYPLRRYLFEDVRGNPALWTRHLRDVETMSFRHRIVRRAAMALNSRLRNAPGIRRRLGILDSWAFRHRKTRELLARIRPDLLVATYPVDVLDATCLLAARQLGIPTAVQLLSWDNVTSKGRFPVVPDSFLSWGPIMTGELTEHYEVPRERIYETGVAHFDGHAKLIDRELQKRLLTEMGLSPDRPFLFFGMSSPHFAPAEIDIVEELARRIRRNEFGPDIDMVVRPHPLNVSGHLADLSWLPRLRAVAGPRVGLCWPLMRNSKLRWALEEKDLGILVNLMNCCLANLNSGSTFGIDGLAHDKPVVMIFFDGDQEVPWHRSVRRGAEYIHMRKLMDTGGLFGVHSYEQLFDVLKRIIADPSMNLEARRAAVRSECTAIDGHSAERIAAAIDQILASSGNRGQNGAETR